MTAIYRAQVSAPFGLFTVAVSSVEQDAPADILTVALSEFNCPAGMLRVKEVKRSNKRLVRNMEPIKKAQTRGKFWAWIRKEGK